MLELKSSKSDIVAKHLERVEMALEELVRRREASPVRTDDLLELCLILLGWILTDRLEQEEKQGASLRFLAKQP